MFARVFFMFAKVFLIFVTLFLIFATLSLSFYAGEKGERTHVWQLVDRGPGKALGGAVDFLAMKAKLKRPVSAPEKHAGKLLNAYTFLAVLESQYAGRWDPAGLDIA